MSVKEVMTNLADAARARYSVSDKLTVADITDLIQGENADVAKLIDRSITKIEIPEGVTEIGKEAFRGCSQLTEVTLPSTITSIGENAFADCTALDNVYCSWVEDAIEGAPWGATEDTSFIYPNTPLVFFAFTDNSSVTLNKVNEPFVEGLLYKRYSESSWSPYICGTTIELQAGEAVYFRNTTALLNWVEIKDITQAPTYHYVQFHMTGVVRSGGDIRSMFNMNDELPPYGCFRMFKDCTALHSDALGIFDLPATTLASDCYREMFSGCTGMIYAPALPATTLASNCYSEMFSGCTGLTEAPKLPATTLKHSCYEAMFYRCSALTRTPELPATVLAAECYKSMFEGCTALEHIRKINAEVMSGHCCYRMFCNNTSLESVYTGFLTEVTELGSECCRSMFKGCSALTSFNGLPEIMETASRCYNEMFSGCSSLRSIEVVFQDWGGGECTTDWLSGVSPTGTFTCPSALPKEYGTSRIPEGWTTSGSGSSSSSSSSIVDETTPLTLTAEEAGSTVKLTATGVPITSGLQYRTNENDDFVPYTIDTVITLTNVGDYVQFYNTEETLSSNNNNYVRFVMTGKIAASGNIQSMLNNRTDCAAFCYYRMFRDCASLTRAPVLPATTLASYCYESMFSGCTSLTRAPALPATTLAYHCYDYMFSGCTSLTRAPALPATTLASYCYNGMFFDCTSLTQAPELPATTLASYCYKSMFYLCRSLAYINVGFTTWSDTATEDWVTSVSYTGTFICPSALPKKYGVNSTPQGWTVVRKD